QVEDAALSFLVEPELAIRVIEVMRLVLKVVTHVPGNDATRATSGVAAGSVLEADRPCLWVEASHGRRVGISYHPAELWINDGSLDEISRLSLQVFGVVGAIIVFALKWMTLT
ncbi:MAG: hypothetical protein R6W68_00890, partial [Ignavibacteriaceae bacterium]